MKGHGRSAGSVHPEGEADEGLLARCIERFGELGTRAADEAAPGDPALAARLRERLSALERLGLLGGAEAGAPLAIGRWRVLAPLGQGGMGSVYLAVGEPAEPGGDWPHAGRRVAIKVGHALGGAGDATSRAHLRFEREIRAVAQLRHEGIVGVVDVGEDGGRPYYAMEYVEGATLERVLDEIRASRVPFAELSTDSIRAVVEGSAARAAGGAWGRTYVECVVRLAIDVAEALAHAHANGIVHRDVKPANVLVRRDGRAKVFDLGLAHLEDQPGLTRSGEFAGSPYYVAPEQIEGKSGAVDRRTDVYALGVTLFELLTLRRPFEGPGTARVLRQIQGREPPLPRTIHAEIPRDLETIVLCALEKDPARRYPSMEELAADLRRFLEFKPVHAKPANAARRVARFVRRNKALSSALALALLVAVGLPIGLAWANARVRSEERLTAAAAAEAKLEAELKSRVLDFLVGQFRLSGSERGAGATITARELVDRGAERIDAEFAQDPAARAALYEATGTVYRNLGLTERAIHQLDRALAIGQSLPDQDPEEVAGLLDQLSAAHLASGDASSALLLDRRGLALLEEAGLGESAQAARTLLTLAEARDLLGEAQAAREHLQRALAIRTQQDGADSVAAAEVRERLGAIAVELSDYDAALAEFGRALAVHEHAWSPDLEALVRVQGELAELHRLRGEPALAAERARSAAALASGAGATGPARELPFRREPPWKDDYDRAFQAGITALQARQSREAIASFERCLALSPGHPVCAYNIACAHALAGEDDPALEWLGRAVGFGFGFSPERLRTAEADADLARLRGNPGFDALLERMRESSRAAAERARTPAVRIPSGAGPWPLLVVVHADGSNAERTIAGPWGELANELGLALLAPCAPLPVGEDGSRWLDDASETARAPSVIEENVLAVVRAFLADHPIDRERVWIAGEGVGAALAFDLALRAPGLFRGVVIEQGPLFPSTGGERAHRAAAVGLRVGAVLDSSRVLPWLPQERNVAGLADELADWLADAGFGERAVVAPVESQAAARARVAELLRAWNP